MTSHITPENYQAVYMQPCTICDRATPVAPPSIRFPRGELTNAHRGCQDKIASAIRELDNAIRTIFSRELERGHTVNAHTAQKKAIEAIHEKCEGKSLLEYAQQEGIQELTHLCDTVGVQAVHTYTLSLLIERLTEQHDRLLSLASFQSR